MIVGALTAGPLDQYVIIEGVQRLAPFQHDEVGDVDDVVDRPHAGVGQPALHPAGGRADLDVADQGRGIAGGQLGVFDIDAALASCNFLHLCRLFRRLQGWDSSASDR